MDIEAVRKRLSQLQTSTTRTTNLWKPQPGKTQIRLLPYKLNSDTPFIELFFHYDLGGKTFLSPISFGRPDPIEEFADKLKSSGNREDWKLGKKLEAKLRTFAPVVVRGEEGGGSKFWGFGKTVYQELLSIISDPDYGDISDPVNGRDVVVEFITAEETGASFPKTNIRVKPNQTVVTEDKAILTTLLDEQKDIREVYNELTYDELAEALHDWLNPNEEGEAKGQETTKAPASSKVLESAVTSTSEVSDAFDDLFNS
jgi:hypothetical protein